MNAIIEEEILKLPKLKHIGLALVQFVCSLENGKFIEKNKNTDWIYKPTNFIAFGFPKRGGEQIRMQFRQFYPQYLDKKDEQILKLYDGRFHHFKCFITEPRQLACAAKYIELSYQHPC
jgi:hypothetical protein